MDCAEEWLCRLHTGHTPANTTTPAAISQEDVTDPLFRRSYLFTDRTLEGNLLAFGVDRLSVNAVVRWENVASA